MNIAISFRVLFFCYYSTLVLGGLYFGLGNITVNYKAAQAYALYTGSGFLVIELSLLVVIAWEIYTKCSNLNYEIELVKEENQYRLKITERERTNTSKSGERKRSKSILTEYSQHSSADRKMRVSFD